MAESERRVCGGCTACCKTHGILTLVPQKMPGKWCSHCEIGKGCRIYSVRPDECQTFRCDWLSGGAGKECHRPDRIRVVSESREIPGIGTALWMFEVSERALEAPMIRHWTLNNFYKGNCVLHVPLHGNPRLYLSHKVPSIDRQFRLDADQRMVDIIPFPESIAAFI